MDANNILDARYHAENVASSALLAHYVKRHSEVAAGVHIENAQASFASLATALGYRIEKITEQKDAA